MQAVILAGGRGTRLRPLTVFTPKPIVPLVNRPFLLYQIDVLKRAGVTDITLSLSYQPDKIQQVLGDGSEFGVSLRYVTEPSPMGTAGAYRYAADGGDEATIVLNGDILTDIELKRLVDFHKTKKAAATLALKAVDDPARFGVIEQAPDQSITRFLEKPKEGETTANTVNAGIYILEREVFNLITPSVNCSFEYDVFPEILNREMSFFGYVLDTEYWRDIGTPESYLQASQDLLGGLIGGFEIDRHSDGGIATRAEIDSTSVLSEGCLIKPGASITASVLGPGVHIEEKAVVENSVIWGHTRIATSAEIRGAIIGRSCHIGRNAIVSPGSVLGDKTTLADYTRI